MDPLTALSLAGSVVQFVDFGSKVLTRSHELYKSARGSLSFIEELDYVTVDLQKLVIKLQHPFGDLKSAHGLTEDEEALQEICSKCRTIAEDMIQRLAELRVTSQTKADRLWQSFRQAVKACWTEDELRDLLNRLMSYKTLLEGHLIVSLRSRIDLVSLQLSDHYQKLDDSTQNIVSALLDNKTALSKDMHSQTMTITQLLNRNQVVLIEHQTEIQKMIVKTLASLTSRIGGKCIGTGKSAGGGKSSTTQEDALVEDDEDFQTMLRQESRIRSTVETVLLEHLNYSTMNERQTRIPEHYGHTFEWALREPPCTGQTWSSLVEWLRNGSGIYWINGKAGSGKSTLMRYMYEHPLKEELLRDWARPLPLSLASAGFFFWNSGTVEQRSQSGLLRSLLYAILDSHRELIPVALPAQWSRKYSQLLDSNLGKELEDWKPPKLKRAFKTVIEQTRIPLKLGLFIDGLDEYEGDHQEIAELFLAFENSPNVKVCLSSRPLLVFKNAFNKFPGLRLQDLTYNDIKEYVTKTFDANPRYQKLAQSQPRRAPALVKEIVTKADGVFLWVTLVVKSLLSGLQNRDGIIDLQRRLLMLPSDLELLYMHMLTRIEPFYQDRAAEIFAIFFANWKTINNFDRVEGEPWLIPGVEQTPLTALTLSFATDDDGDDILEAEGEDFNHRAIAERCDIIADRLKVRCAGLLEIEGPDNLIPKTDARVQFLHRTVRDYLEKPDVWNKLVARATDPSFNAYSALLRAYVVELRMMLLPANVSSKLWDKAWSILTFATHTDAITGEANLGVLDKFDSIMSDLPPDMKLKTCYNGETPYWANYRLIWDTNEMNYHHSFISVAVQYNLLAFVEKRLNSARRQNPERSLLDFAVNPIIRQYYYPTGSKMVQLLLDNGESPNEKYNGWSPWENAILWQVEYKMTSTGSSAEESTVAQTSMREDIFRVLIEHDADPNACRQTLYGTYTALSAVNLCFSSLELQRLLNEKCPKLKIPMHLHDKTSGSSKTRREKFDGSATAFDERLLFSGPSVHRKTSRAPTYAATIYAGSSRSSSPGMTLPRLIRGLSKGF